MRKLHIIILSAFLVTGCVAPGAGEPSPAQAIGRGLGHQQEHERFDPATSARAVMRLVVMAASTPAATFQRLSGCCIHMLIA